MHNTLSKNVPLHHYTSLQFDYSKQDYYLHMRNNL